MPQTSPNIYPALSYRDAAAAIDWLVTAFGFQKLMVVPNPDGTIAHAELSFGPGVIMLGTAKQDKGWMSPRDLSGVNQTLYVYVEDLDAHYARARAAGAEVGELYDTDYGSHEYSARDLEGHYWSFGTYLPER
jgi:uncharacterized glyoxalase superfamily protein PhnB